MTRFATACAVAISITALLASKGEIVHALVQSNAQAVQVSHHIVRAEALSPGQGFPLDNAMFRISNTLLRLGGQIRLQDGRFDEAIDLLIEATQRRPDDKMAHFWLGHAYRAAGREPEAIDAWRVAGAAPYFYAIGFLSNESRDRTGAERAELTAVAVDPQLTRAYELLASIYWGDRERAVWALDHIIELTQSDGTYVHDYARARRAYMLRQWEEASSLFDAASRDMSAGSSELGWLYYFWGDARREMRDTVGAEDLFLRAIQLNPGNFAAFRALANIYELQARYEESARYHSLALRLAPDWAEGYARLAFALGHMGCQDEAIEASDRSLALAPGHEPYRQLRSLLEKGVSGSAGIGCAVLVPLVTEK